MRELTNGERVLLDFLLSADFPGRDALRKQLATAKVEELDDCPCLCFHLTEPIRAEVTRRVPIEASAKDSDGIEVQVLLHVVDGRASELEWVKTDGSKIQQLPTIRDFKRFCPTNWAIE